MIEIRQLGEREKKNKKKKECFCRLAMSSLAQFQAVLLSLLFTVEAQSLDSLDFNDGTQAP